MSVKWTNNQLKAINSSGNNILVSAAAGSGKTAVLVERVIKMVTDANKPVPLDKILMVTFTNAAAAEMKTRINNALTKCIENDPDNPVLYNQLSLIDQAQISTIHSFCQNLLKDNFYKADISPDFTIVDEVLNNQIKDEVVEQVIEEGYELFSEEMDRLVLIYGGRFDDTKLKNLIISLYKFIQCQPCPTKWLLEMCDIYNKDFNDTLWAKSIVSQVKSSLSNLSELYDIARELSEFGLVLKYIDFLSAEQVMLESVIEEIDDNWDKSYDALNKMVFERLPAKDKDCDEECAAKAKKLRDTVKENVLNCKKLICAKSDVITNELKNQSSMLSCVKNLVLMFAEKYAEAKKEKNLLDFDDLLHLTLDKLLADDEIAGELKNRFDEILVDEYQDTNAVNIAIFEKLSKGNNLFMVGDVKQSIYGFLNASPESFTNKYLSFSFDGNENGLKIPLSNNFRSADNVLYYINHLFERIMSSKTAGIDYTDDQRLVYSNTNVKTDLPVEVHLLETKDETGDYPDNDKLSNEAFFVAKRILSLVEVEKPMVFDSKLNSERPIRYGDIAILARSVKKDVAAEFTRQLALMGIPVACEETGSYLLTVEISTVISCLKIIDNPYQDIPLLAVMRSPMFLFTENELASIKGKYPNVPFYKAVLMAEDDKTTSFKKVLHSLKEFSKSASIELLIEKILSVTGYYSFVGNLPNGKQRMANLKLLSQRANSFEAGGRKSIFEYIKYIDMMLLGDSEYKNAKIISDNDNVVNVMTIHKSKGLEFPAVFLVQCGKGFGFKRNNLVVPAVFDAELGIGFEYIDNKKMIRYPSLPMQAIKNNRLYKDIAEEIRVLYVALTRAKNYLCIVGSVADCDKKLQKYKDVDVTTNSVLEGKCFMDWILAGTADLNIEKTHSIKDILTNTIVLPQKMEKINNEEAISYGEVEKRLSYNYAFCESLSIPSKISVSELAAESVMPRLSKISDATGKLSKANKGTITHFVMQNIDLSKTSGEEIALQIENMQSSGMLSEKECDVVDVNAIARFFETETGIRLKNSLNCVREYSFCTEIAADLLFDDVKVKDKVLVQGTVDCFFEEKGELVILDYKTGKLDEKYKKQIEIYKMCLENIFKKPIKETILVNLL